MAKKVFSAPKVLLAFCLFCFALLGCKNEVPFTLAPPSFYHWKTQFKLTSGERSYLDSLGVKKIYAKFFDVDWDATVSQPVPLALIEIDTTLLAGIEVVPTVFVTNRTLLNLPTAEVDSLARRILQKLALLAYERPEEIQFDCDWTAQTRDKYFALLNAAQRNAPADLPFASQHPPLKISATIRLHQFKYPDKTGVPPVDRGMLMCYNMGDLEDWGTENSIIDPVVASAYLPHGAANSYPLPLDVALPIFRWGVLFREGEMVKLINNLSSTDLQDDTRFHQTAPNRYEVVKSTYQQAHYLYKGDQIRLEAADPATVQRMAQLLGENMPATPSLAISFYHLDTTNLRFFPKARVDAILDQF